MLLTLFGLAGAVMILVAYVQVSRHVWQPKSFEFQLTNLVGSVILTGYSIAIHAYPIALLNVVWAAVAARTLLHRR